MYVEQKTYKLKIHTINYAHTHTAAEYVSV